MLHGSLEIGETGLEVGAVDGAVHADARDVQPEVGRERLDDVRGLLVQRCPEMPGA